MKFVFLRKICLLAVFIRRGLRSGGLHLGLFVFFVPFNFIRGAGVAQWIS